MQSSSIQGLALICIDFINVHCNINVTKNTIAVTVIIIIFLVGVANTSTIVI